MKPLTFKEKVARVNKEICPRFPYEFDGDGRLFQRACDGEPLYETERGFNSFYSKCFVRGKRRLSEFKRRVNRTNRHKERVLTKDEERADSLSGVVHKGDIWDID